MPLEEGQQGYWCVSKADLPAALQSLEDVGVHSFEADPEPTDDLQPDETVLGVRQRGVSGASPMALFKLVTDALAAADIAARPLRGGPAMIGDDE